MNDILKLNAISILYAFIILIPIELMLNTYRIDRLTGMDSQTVSTITDIAGLIIAIAGGFLAYFFSKKWLGQRKIRFWSILLWLPYFALFQYIIGALFPITHGGDEISAGAGLLALGVMFLFPLYILFINICAEGGDSHLPKQSS
ncbi:hypothetical protein A8F94_08925 [Bacillus sp. FJAT-27225]|uniref:hypothetical protein n=1 Tax=Bacillus sp. FJAT-27225 TaxID=1743144 RepID=UPI00080C2289|nr:hypothetical protein [Bacillus sp. FJAT-27225]OCA87940.1 hypothetical protein A8F94_08925 [Bacillus sp. FJAT-27225]